MPKFFGSDPFHSLNFGGVRTDVPVPEAFVQLCEFHTGVSTRLESAHAFR